MVRGAENVPGLKQGTEDTDCSDVGLRISDFGLRMSDIGLQIII